MIAEYQKLESKMLSQIVLMCYFIGEESDKY